MIDWIRENFEHLLAAVGALYLLALAIVKMTPTKKDDEALAKVSDVVRLLAGLFGLKIPHVGDHQAKAEVTKSVEVDKRKGHARLELLIVLAAVLAIMSAGCASPGDQYQASAMAFVVAVDAAAELRKAGRLEPEDVEAIDVAVDEGHAALALWAEALKAGQGYPSGPEVVIAVVNRIRARLPKARE